MALRGRLVTGPRLNARLAASQGGGPLVPDGSIGTDKLADGAVTGPKIAIGAVTGDKLDVDLVYNVTDGDLTISLS